MKHAVFLLRWIERNVQGLPLASTEEVEGDLYGIDDQDEVLFIATQGARERGFRYTDRRPRKQPMYPIDKPIPASVPLPKPLALEYVWLRWGRRTAYGLAIDIAIDIYVRPEYREAFQAARENAARNERNSP